MLLGKRGDLTLQIVSINFRHPIGIRITIQSLQSLPQFNSLRETR